MLVVAASCCLIIDCIAFGPPVTGLVDVWLGDFQKIEDKRGGEEE